MFQLCSRLLKFIVDKENKLSILINGFTEEKEKGNREEK